MTSVDTNVDLIINQLTEEQYFQLSVQGKIDDNQIYLVPDNREYYEKSQTSSNVELTRKFDELSLDITNVATKHYVDSSISSLTPQSYTAGYGLNLNDYQFNIDTSKIAEVSDLIIYE